MAINFGPNYGNPWNGTMNMPNLNMMNNQNQPQMNNALFPNQLSQQDSGSLMAILVQGEAGANAYPVASGNTVMLVDFESGKFWLKSNVNGVPQRLRKFSFSEEIDEQAQTSNNVQFITRDEFDKLSQSVSSLSQNVNKLVTELGGVSNE